MNEQALDSFDLDHAQCTQSFMEWMKKERPIDEVPGSDHERRIAWYAFREGWNAARSPSTGSTGEK
jgi:hypothetical protein